MIEIPLPAVILAGGHASRMGGGDKVLLPLGGRRVFDHIRDQLAPQCGSLALNANGDPARFADLGLTVLPDSLSDCPGPLAGVLAAMDWAAGLGHARVITVPGDTPFFPRDLVAALRAHSDVLGPVLAATCDDSGTSRLQPTFGLWPVALRAVLRSDLAAGVRKVRYWARMHGATLAHFDDDGRMFFNINTPADLYAADALLSCGQSGLQA